MWNGYGLAGFAVSCFPGKKSLAVLTKTAMAFLPIWLEALTTWRLSLVLSSYTQCLFLCELSLLWAQLIPCHCFGVCCVLINRVGPLGTLAACKSSLSLAYLHVFWTIPVLWRVPPWKAVQDECPCGLFPAHSGYPMYSHFFVHCILPTWSSLLAANLAGLA